MLDPLCSCQRLTFWAVPITARVKAVAFVVALIAAFEMPAKDSRAAHFDGSHDAALCRWTSRRHAVVDRLHHSGGTHPPLPALGAPWSPRSEELRSEQAGA